jgi:hypothetical protein
MPRGEKLCGGIWNSEDFILTTSLKHQSRRHLLFARDMYSYALPIAYCFSTFAFLADHQTNTWAKNRQQVIKPLLKTPNYTTKTTGSL